jgi:erythrin-vacuolar iron transport family protein
MKTLNDLTEQEVLALAISNEEEDSRIYHSFAMKLAKEFPATAKIFEDMAVEEQEHKNMLLDLHQKQFGDTLPYITRQDVKGFMKRQPLWLMDKLNIEAVRRMAQMMEYQAAEFYTQSAAKAQNVEVRKLLGDLAIIERGHQHMAEESAERHVSGDARSQEDLNAQRMFLLQIVQPGLTGLIDGSISTLAPIFAAAFATHSSHDAFIVGLAASVGSGISMGLTEAMSDDGKLTGRGHPALRGTVCGLMTTVGGLGHTLPYLITDFWTATTLAVIIVAAELIAISWIRWKYMDTPFTSAMVQVILGGILVLLTGIFIGGF